MGTLLLRAAIAGILVIVPAIARKAVAQEAESDSDPASASEVLPPRLLADPGVEYPAAALRERFYEPVDVGLILEIDAAGTVAGIHIENPGRPAFDEAATRAAERLRFEPAQRNGIPVPARIRWRYTFVPPPPSLTGTVVDAATGKSVSGARITVRDSSKNDRLAVTGEDGSWAVRDVARGSWHVAVESSGHEPQSADVRLTPGDETRVDFRLAPRAVDPATDSPPAVEVTVRGERLAPTVSSYTRAEVRQVPGAFGDPFRAVETLPGVTPLASGLPFFYLRGAPPGNVGYFLDGVRVPYLFHIGAGPSVVHPGIVERVDLYPGGYPARFGRFAGGIVSASTAEPRPELHGEGNLRLFDAGALVESGFAGGRGTVLAGGRYSYTAALLSLAAPDIDLAYHDFQSRISYDVTPNDRVSVFAFGAYDLLMERDEILFGSEFYRADLRYDHFFDGGTVRTAVTLGYDRTNAGIVADDGDQRNVADRSIRARTEINTAVGSDAVLRAGLDAGVDSYRVEGVTYGDPDSPAAQRFRRNFPERLDFATGAWVDLTLTLSPAIQILPGLRADVYGSGSTTAVGVDPRLAARFEVVEGFRVVSAVGIAHQPPAFLVPLPGIAPHLRDGLQRALQTSAGIEADLDPSTTAGSTLFYSAFFDMTDAFGTSSGDPDENLDLRTRGSAHGAEVFLRRRLTQRLGGLLSYTLSRSVRRRDGADVVSSFDRTHVVNSALSHDLGRGWRAGGRFLYYTGTPVWRSGDDEGAEPRRRDGEREPSFFRLDLRLEKRWRLGDTSWIAFVTEFLNATLNKETWPGGEEIGPISIPSLGVEAGF